MKYCKECKQEVRIRKHDGICPDCGAVVDEKDVERFTKKHTQKVEVEEPIKKEDYMTDPDEWSIKDINPQFTEEPVDMNDDEN